MNIRYPLYATPSSYRPSNRNDFESRQTAVISPKRIGKGNDSIPQRDITKLKVAEAIANLNLSNTAKTTTKGYKTMCKNGVYDTLNNSRYKIGALTKNNFGMAQQN